MSHTTSSPVPHATRSCQRPATSSFHMLCCLFDVRHLNRRLIVLARLLLVVEAQWSQLVGSIPYKEAEWRTRAARFCDSKMFGLSSSAHAAGLWEDGIHGLWELAMQVKLSVFVCTRMLQAVFVCNHVGQMK